LPLSSVELRLDKPVNTVARLQQAEWRLVVRPIGLTAVVECHPLRGALPLGCGPASRY